MKKIPTLFIRDPNNMGLVTREVHPDCKWVIQGEGTPTVKWDGTSCLWQDMHWWKRYTLWKGKKSPPDFVPTGDPAPDTGKQAGWIPVVFDRPENCWHKEAVRNLSKGHLCYMPSNADPLSARTFELIGPKINGNPYGLFIGEHILLRHGDDRMGRAPREFDAFPKFFKDAIYTMSRLELNSDCPRSYELEGIIWHHPDGRMAKIKRKDFGLPWPITKEED